MVPPTPKRMMWRVTEAPWRMLQRTLCCSFAAFSLFWGLVSSQYLISTSKVDVTPRFAEVFRSVLSGVGGSIGGWRCCWGTPSLPQLPPATSKNPPPTLVCCFCVFAAMGVTSTKSGGTKSVFIWEAGWEEPFGNNYTFSCFRNLEIWHGHPFVAAYIYGNNAWP